MLEHLFIKPDPDAADGADVLAEDTGHLGRGEAELDKQADAVLHGGHLAQAGQAADEVGIYRSDFPFHLFPIFGLEHLSGGDAPLQADEIVGLEKILFHLFECVCHDGRPRGLFFRNLGQLLFDLPLAAREPVQII